MNYIEEMLRHPNFRGLWISNCTELVDGKLEIEVGWSCTFVKNGEYHDLYYRKTPEEACEAALEMLSLDSRSNILNSVDVAMKKLRS